MALSTLDRFSTSAIIKALSRLCNQSSKPSFKKIIGIFKLLLITFGISLEKIPNIN